MGAIEAGERFATIFREQQPAVHAYLVGRTSDPAQAADLTQEVFLRAWRHLAELLGRSADGQRAWLFTVARNIAVDDGRRARTRAETLATVAALHPDRQRSADDEAQAVADLDRVGRAIAALPEDLRITLSMATTAGMTSPEIGSALGVAPGTVRYRLSTARALLARALAGSDDEPAQTPPPPSGHERSR